MWGPCDTCLHCDHESVNDAGMYCAAPPGQGFPFVYRNMPFGEGCSKHVLGCADCREAPAVNLGDVPRCDECAGAIYDAQQAALVP